MDLSVTSIHPSRMITKVSPRQSPDMQWVVHKSVVLPMSTSDLSTLVLEIFLSISAPSSECCPDGLPLYPSTLQVLLQTPSPKHTRVLVLFLYLSVRQIPSFAYEGKGELFAINGGEEAVAFDYPRQDPVFTITGEANVAYVPNWNGSGTAVLSGTAVERVAVNPPARGDLFKLTISMSVEHIIITPVLLISSTESAMVLLLRQSLILGSLLTMRTRSFRTTEMINSSILSRDLVATTSIMDS